MATKKRGQSPPSPRAPRRQRLVLTGLGVALITTVAWIFHELRPAKTATSGNARAQEDSTSSSSASAPAGYPPWMTSAQAQQLRVPTPLPPERQPWESTKENTPPLPPGFLPAWSVNPHPPEPTDLPPAPREPANPIVNPPPRLNPGGVEGQRGPRPVAFSQRRLTNSRAALPRSGEDGNARIRLKPDNDPEVAPPASP